MGDCYWMLWGHLPEGIWCSENYSLPYHQVEFESCKTWAVAVHDFGPGRKLLRTCWFQSWISFPDGCTASVTSTRQVATPICVETTDITKLNDGECALFALPCLFGRFCHAIGWSAIMYTPKTSKIQCEENNELYTWNHYSLYSWSLVGAPELGNRQMRAINLGRAGAAQRASLSYQRVDAILIKNKMFVCSRFGKLCGPSTTFATIRLFPHEKNVKLCETNIIELNSFLTLHFHAPWFNTDTHAW